MTRSRIVRYVVAAVSAALIATTLAVAPVNNPSASAVTSGASFDAGFIISDEVFYNRAAMNAGQIQAFLNDKGRNCVANSLPCLKDIPVSWPLRAGDAYCGTMPAGSGRAAELFVAVAAACGISPQVLLVLVEKEQSLVSRTSPSDRAYRFATGFNCPDTAPCSDASSGFATQVYLAAKQFQRYRVNPGSYNYQAGRVNNILFNPNPACGSSPVFIRNQATAGLYDYTPYQPNASALNNMYGVGDGCGAYGNRNFFRMFSDWFGSPGNLLTASSFEGSVARWAFTNGSMSRQIAGPTTGAQSGNYFLSMYAPAPMRSLSQDVPLALSPRQAYTGSIWVKSGTVGKTFSGTLALWAMGGTNELAQTSFTVGETWTEVKTTLPVQRAGHNVLRLEVYLKSTDALLSMDNTSLYRDVAVTPRAPLTMTSPSFEGGVGTWAFNNGTMNRQVYNVGTQAKDGAWILAANTPAAGRSIGQDAAVSASAGDSYTATIWLRSSSATQNFEGTLAVWGLGGTAQAATRPFSVGSAWTPVSTTLTLGSPASTIRLEVYLNSVNFDLWLDNASIVPNLAANPSFEANANAWNTGVTPAALDWLAQTATVPAADGRGLAITKTTFTGGSVATDVKRALAVGDTYQASIWLKSATPGVPWTGTLAVWALGGTNEAATLAVSAGDTWTQFVLPITIAQAGHDTLRFELYNGGAATQLYLDGAIVR